MIRISSVQKQRKRHFVQELVVYGCQQGGRIHHSSVRVGHEGRPRRPRCSVVGMGHREVVSARGARSGKSGRVAGGGADLGGVESIDLQEVGGAVRAELEDAGRNFVP